MQIFAHAMQALKLKLLIACLFAELHHCCDGMRVVRSKLWEEECGLLQ